MMSPTPAERRFDPPSTLMHCTRVAPLLSATSRLDCIWIIDPVPSHLAFRDMSWTVHTKNVARPVQADPIETPLEACLSPRHTHARESHGLFPAHPPSPHDARRCE